MQSATVGIRDAKIHLSKYLKMVQQGTEVIITDRGRPVGKIIPISTKDLPLKERIKRMEDLGQIEVAANNGFKKNSAANSSPGRYRSKIAPRGEEPWIKA